MPCSQIFDAWLNHPKYGQLLAYACVRRTLSCCWEVQWDIAEADRDPHLSWWFTEPRYYEEFRRLLLEASYRKLSVPDLDGFVSQFSQTRRGSATGLNYRKACELALSISRFMERVFSEWRVAQMTTEERF